MSCDSLKVPPQLLILSEYGREQVEEAPFPNAGTLPRESRILLPHELRGIAESLHQARHRFFP